MSLYRDLLYGPCFDVVRNDFIVVCLRGFPKQGPRLTRGLLSLLAGLQYVTGMVFRDVGPLCICFFATCLCQFMHGFIELELRLVMVKKGVATELELKLFSARSQAKPRDAAISGTSKASSALLHSAASVRFFELAL